jgi:uncharacterized small protein (DUF1192 family)
MDIEEKSMHSPTALLEMHKEDLSDASIYELEERITILNAEVVRVKLLISNKKDSQKSAESFFKT